MNNKNINRITRDGIRITRYHFAIWAALAAGSGGVLAAPMLQEVVVTAQKREQNLQETPISLAVIDAAAVERMGITNVGDIGNAVPNLTVIPFGVSPTTLRFYIRGIGTVDSQITQDPPVGIYLDGVYMARNSGLALDVADIERVEVLRGPQGTLYGRNTTGGAINLVTRRPGRNFEFSQLISLGRFDQLRSKTLVNVPLGDAFAAKLGYEKHERDGWIDNVGAGDDFHAYDRDAWRIDLRWMPVDAITVDYAYDHSESDFSGGYYHLHEVSPAFAGILAEQRHRLDRAALPSPYRSGHDEVDGHSLTVTVDTPLGEFKSISAYRELDQNAYQDYSANPDISIFLNNPFTLQQKQISQEFQLVGATDSETLDYVVGLYYFKEKGDEVAVDEITIASFQLPRDVSIENRAWAAYAQVTWRPAGNSPWAFTLGGRYTRDEREADNHLVAPASTDFTNFNPSFTAEYRVSDRVSLYGKVVSGYKSGGFNLRQANFSENFDEETLVSYEIGWKSEWFQRRLRVNGALFYADYDDIQLDILVPDQPDPTLTRTENAGTAEIYGLELDTTLLIADNLRATLAYGWLDSEIDEVRGDDASLYHLPNAPRHSVTATLDWDVAQLPVGVLNFSFDYAWKDHYVTGVRELVGIDVGAYGVANVRLTLTGNDWVGKGRFRVALWGKNLFDKEYFADTFGSFNGLHANRIATYGDPRTYGLDLEYRY